MAYKTRKEPFMNVEIAQRLAELRREKGYSQEELAENLGLSRQAVSKWERAESSPDIGNLVALAKLYEVTLDELLRVEEDIEDDLKFETQDRAVSIEAEAKTAAEQANVAAAQAQAAAAQAQALQVQIEQHAAAAQAQATQQAQAAHAQAAQTLPSVPHAPQATQIPPSVPHASPHYDAAYQATQSQGYASAPHTSASPAPKVERKKTKGPWTSFPYPVLCVIVFLGAGFFVQAWHPAWVVFLTIPLYYWIAAIIENDPNYRK